MSEAARARAEQVIDEWVQAQDQVKMATSSIWMSVRSSITQRIADALDAYAAERTAAEAAKHADCCVDREELAALRAAYRDVIVAAQCVHDHAPAGTVGLAALCAPLGAAPEAAP